MPQDSWWLRRFTPMGWFICSLIGSVLFFCFLGVELRRDLSAERELEREVSNVLHLMAISQRQDDVSRQDTLERVIRLEKFMEGLADYLHEAHALDQAESAKRLAQFTAAQAQLVEALETAVPEARWKLRLGQQLESLTGRIDALTVSEERQPK